MTTAAATVWLTGGNDDWRDRDLRVGDDATLRVPVLMSVRGGIEGLDELVVVRPSGRYVVQFGRGRSVDGQVTPDELRDIATALARAELEVVDVTGPTDACCDLVYTLLSYGPWSYEATNGAGGRAAELISQLDRLIERGRTSTG